MKNLLWKYPIIYLLLFCCGSLLFGFEIAEVIESGLPSERTKHYLKIGSLVGNLLISIYFLYYYVKIKNMKENK